MNYKKIEMSSLNNIQKSQFSVSWEKLELQPETKIPKSKFRA